MRVVFSGIHGGNLWGHAESLSGPGSTVAETRVLRAALPKLIAELGVRTVLDAPCGDFNWMRHLDLPIERYCGVDVVPELAEQLQGTYGNDRRVFLARDICRDPLPQADLILCRDCLIHLSLRFIDRALRNFKASRSRYILTTTYQGIGENEEIVTGSWRPINLELPPFKLPPPMLRLEEKSYVEGERQISRGLGLWALADL